MNVENRKAKSQESGAISQSTQSETQMGVVVTEVEREKGDMCMVQ